MFAIVGLNDEPIVRRFYGIEPIADAIRDRIRPDPEAARIRKEIAAELDAPARRRRARRD